MTTDKPNGLVIGDGKHIDARLALMLALIEHHRRSSHCLTAEELVKAADTLYGWIKKRS